MVVSLCMIAYNEAEAIQGLFSDISLQDYPHEKIEIVFVDSMSTDATYARTTVLWTSRSFSAPSATRRFLGTPRL